MHEFDPVKYINTPYWQNSRLGLERINKLLDMLDNPQKNLSFIHVAGTNGKGSTCAYIAQILIESGYKTGQFTSPYIYEFSERIRINNINISDEELKKVTLLVKEQADKFPKNDHPTEFELMTAVAFMYFSEQNCDLVVCEVGMGGRLDSTNVLTKSEVVASVICPIDMDHMQFLGNTLSAIATEKAEIIKENIPVISACQHSDVVKVLEKKCQNMNCNLRFAQENLLKISAVNLEKPDLYRSFSYKKFDDLKTNLLAIYQPKNACLAIEVADLLSNIYKNINEQTIYKGINNCQWPARFQIISKNPYVIIDGGHNVQGVNVLLESLVDVFKEQKFFFIMGVLADKDYEKMVDAIAPYAKKVFTVTPPNPRKLEAEMLAQKFQEKRIQATSVNIKDAIFTAKNESSEKDVICAFGSLYSISSLTENL